MGGARKRRKVKREIPSVRVVESSGHSGGNYRRKHCAEY